MRRLLAGLAVVAGTLAASPPAAAADAAAEPGRRAYVSIVIDDIGYRRQDGLRALELPGAVTYAVLPHTPHGPSIARLAAQLGKEVLLHLPMESQDQRRLGPGGVTTAMAREELQSTVLRALVSVPHASGVSNHMGSRFTGDLTRMEWVMQAIASRPGLYFLDSRTTEHSVVREAARRHGVATHTRDVFLDNSRDPRLIRRQFMELVGHARRHGRALGIGHPFPETVAVLAEMIPRLDGLGITLVPVARLMTLAPPPAPTPATLRASAEEPVLAR